MCDLQIRMQGHGGIFEVLPTEVENAELEVENAVVQVLLDLFGEGAVDDVTIRFFSPLHLRQLHCSIQIQAQCSYESFRLLPRTKENIEREVEMSICSVLRELFGSMSVDSVVLGPSPRDHENASALRGRFRLR